MVTNEVLSMVDNINESVTESWMYVMEAYTGLIYKEAAEVEKSKPDGVFAKVKDASKNDKNGLVTFLKFIPRLIVAIAKTIHDKFAKANVEESISNLKAFTTGGSSGREKLKRVQELNKKFKGTCEFYYDPKSDKIKVKRKSGDFIAKLAWASSFTVMTYELFKKIKQVIENDPNNPTAVKQLINDCKSLLDRNEQNKPGKLDVTTDTLEAVAETTKTASLVAGEITLLASTIQSLSEKRLQKTAAKRYLTQEDIDANARLTELTNNVTRIGTMVSGTLGSISLLTKFNPFLKEINANIKKWNARDEFLVDRVIRKNREHLLDMSQAEHLKKHHKQEVKEFEEDYQEAHRRAVEKLNAAGKDPNKYLSQGLIDEEYPVVFDERINRLIAARNNNNP